MWERFFNWQSDMDWTWGPLVFLRPPPDQPILPWVWIRLFVLLTGLGLLLTGSLAAIILWLPSFAATHRRLLPVPLTDTLETLRLMGSDPQTRLVLLGLASALPPLFFAFCLPYHWAWNRRATRLQNTIGISANEAQGVWPPAPG